MSRTKRQLPFTGPALTPPPSLTEAQAAVFKATIAAVDPDHFNPADLPLIIEFCRCTISCEEAAGHLQEEGSVIDGKVSPWVTVAEKSQRALVAIAGKLRVCPASRFDRLVAGTRSRAQFKKPWEGSSAEPVLNAFA